MRYEPVFLEDGLNGRASMTFLKHYSLCPRSGYLYARFKGEASTREMQRGKAVHLIHERAVQTMLDQGEATIPPELVKAIADEVLAEIPVPFEEHDAIREQAFRLGSELAVDVDRVVACETLFALDVAGYEVRCRIDYAELLDDGATIYVADLKSSRAAVPFEEISRKMPDGRLTATSFQLVLYALALVYGVPVREGTCWACRGSRHEPWENVPCDVCHGEPRTETRDPFEIAPRAQHANLEFVYPAIEDREGKMLRRSVTLTRPEIEQYRASLDGLLHRVAESERTGDWPAVASDAACSICPAARLCPIPVELNDHRGAVDSPEDCADALERRLVEKKLQAQRQKAIRAFVKEHGPVRFGGDMVAEIESRVADRISDRDAMFDAVERARLYGEPFDRSEYVKTVESFPLVERALTPDELAAVPAEEEGYGDRRYRELKEAIGDEQRRDGSRFGDEPPF